MYPTGITKNALDKWAEMTDNNMHSEVRASICNWAYLACLANGERWKCDFYQHAETLFNTLPDVNSDDWVKLNEIGHSATKMLFETLTRDFGPDIADDIYKCL